MYPWIWRHLPGPWPLKSLLSAGLLFVVLAALVLYVFPWAEETLPFLQVTVQE